MSYGTVENVINKAQVSKDSLDIGTESEFESFIQDLLDAATDEINKWLGRDLSEGTKTVTVDGTDRPTVKLPDYPIESIDSVEVNGDTVDPDKYRLNDAGIIERAEMRWPSGWNNIEVSYTVAGSRGVADSVAEEMVKDALTAADAQGKAAGTDSVSMDGYSASFDTSTQMNLTEEYRDRLRPFREIGVK